MTTEHLPVEAADAGAQPVNAPVAPAPAPGRDVATVQADLLKIMDDLDSNTDWTRREQLIETRGRLRQELDALERKAKPTVDAAKLAAAEKKDSPAEGEKHPDPSLSDFGKVEIQVPEALSQGHKEEAAVFAQDVGALAVTAGIDQQTAQTIFEYAVDLAALEAPDSWDANDPGAAVGTLAVRYGAEAAGQIVKDAQAATRKLGPSVGAWLDQTGLGNAPSVLEALAAYGRGEFGRSPADAAAELKKLRQSPGYANGERATVNRARLLSAIAARGQNAEAETPKKGAASAPTSRDRIEGQIKALRANPAYLDRDSPSHKEVVAQVAELYRKLDG
jgi:hypothetical protein